MTKATPRSRRRAERKELSAEVAFRRAGLNSYKAKVFDASPEGCRVEFVDRPRVGEVVWIKFDGMRALEASVRWVHGFEVGLQFNEPFHPAVFESLFCGQQ